MMKRRRNLLRRGKLNDNSSARTTGDAKLAKAFLIMAVIFAFATAFVANSLVGRKELLLKEFLEKKEEKDEKDEPSPHPPYHVVFSTSCNDQQHWESFVFFYHANKVKQPGTVTRIVSGCKDHEADWLQKFHDEHIKTMNPDFHLHLTPDFARLGNTTEYKYMNKPYGLRHWMENALRMGQPDQSPDTEDGIVFLMDPDMILLRPIVHDYTDEDVIYAKGDKPDWKIVEHGRPMAQQDGYLNNQWMHLNISFVTHGGDIKGIRQPDGPKYWNTGPPYLATVRDMYSIVVLWTEYAPRVHHIYPKLFAEMYGYIIATTQLKLSHTLIKSLVVSTTRDDKIRVDEREGWPYIDALPDEAVCDLQAAVSAGKALPVVLHYCQRYGLATWFFSKYRLEKKYISCETPILLSPPKDLAAKKYNYWLQPPPDGHTGEWDPPRKEMSARTAKREAFMICGLISLVNEAAVHFKTKACNGRANMSANYTFFSDDYSYD